MTKSPSTIEKYAKRTLTITAALSTMLYSTTAMADCSVTSGTGTVANPNNGDTITCVSAGGAQTTLVGTSGASDVTVDIQDDAVLSGAGRVRVGSGGTVTLGENTSLSVTAGTGAAPISASSDITVNLSGDNASIEGAGGGGVGAGPAISVITSSSGVNVNATVTLSGDNTSVIGHDSGVYVYSGDDGDATATVTLSGDGSSVSTDDGAAINVYSYYGNASVNVTLGANTSITSTAATTAAAISAGTYSGANAADSSIVNNGTISANTRAISLSGGDDTVTSSGDITGDVDLGSGDDIFTIDLDTGSFAGTADGGAHSAGDVLNVDASDGDATLGGGFTNFETVNLTGNNTITTDGTHTNETINLLGTTNLSVAGTSSVTATSGVIGSGSGNDINVASGGALIADVALSTGTNTVTNAGAITGDLNFSTGTDSVNLNGGNITGNVVDGNIGSGLSSLFLNASTAISGNTVVDNATFGAGNTLTTGSFTGTNLTFNITDDTTFGVLNVTGGAIDLTGSTVTVSAADGISDGTEFQIGNGTAQVIGLDGTSGQAFTSVADTSLLLDFGIADGSQAEVTTGSADNSELFLVAAKSTTPVKLVTNATNARGAIETPVLSTNPEIAAILSNTNTASNIGELTDVLHATIPAVDGGSFSAAKNVTGNTLRLVSDRLTVIRSHGGSASGVSSGDLAKNLQVWGQAFGQVLRQGERKNVAGFDATTRGLTVGADSEGIYEGATIGLAFSYADSTVKSRSVNSTNSDIGSYNISLYGDYDLTDSSYLVGDIGYTYGDNESTRFNVGGVAGLNANSDYDSHQIEARLIAARDYSLTNYNGVRITPKVQAHYIRFQNEDITETGAGGASLSIDSEALHIFELGVGVDARKDYKQSNGGIFSPEVSVGYRYDVVGDALQTTSTFAAGGPSFRSEGADPDQGTFNLGLGLGYVSTDSLELTASYDYENKDAFSSHSAFLRAAMPF